MRCGGGAKAVPELSYRLPVCASVVGRQLTLFKGDFFPLVFPLPSTDLLGWSGSRDFREVFLEEQF